MNLDIPHFRDCGPRHFLAAPHRPPTPPRRVAIEDLNDDQILSMVGPVRCDPPDGWTHRQMMELLLRNRVRIGAITEADLAQVAA